MRIIHPTPQPGRQRALGVEFRDGVAHVDELHPERELALTQHGFVIATEIEGFRLEDLTIAELRDIADTEGIELPAKAKHAEIVALIEAAPVPVIGELAPPVIPDTTED